MIELPKVIVYFVESQKNTLPQWLVTIRDFIVPIVTMAGGILGIIAFFLWNHRKVKEHRLSRQTKAFEILLTSEFDGYKKVIPLLNNLNVSLCKIVMTIHPQTRHIKMKNYGIKSRYVSLGLIEMNKYGNQIESVLSILGLFMQASIVNNIEYIKIESDSIIEIVKTYISRYNECTEEDIENLYKRSNELHEYIEDTMKYIKNYLDKQTKLK